MNPTLQAELEAEVADARAARDDAEETWRAARRAESAAKGRLDRRERALWDAEAKLRDALRVPEGSGR